MRTQIKQAHWNVKGPEFIALPKLFDEIKDDVEEYVDAIAERAVQLGGTVEETARAVAAKLFAKGHKETFSDGVFVIVITLTS